MIKKNVSLMLICILLLTANASIISAQTKADDSITKEVKAAVKERGTGEKKRVEVKMLDGTKLKGYISDAGEDSFTLVDSKTKQSTTIAYSDVAKVKNSGMSGDKIALIIIGSAAAVGAVVLGTFLLKRCQNEGGC